MLSIFRISILTFLAAFSFVCASAQPEKAAKQLPFASGETLTYEGKISRLLISISIADVVFTADKVPDSTNYRIRAKATSKGTLLKLFGFSFLQDYESIVDFTNQRVLKTTKHDVQKERVRDSIADFDYTQRRVSYTETDPKDQNRPPRRIASAIEEPMYDLVTGIYSIRPMKLSVGQSFNVSLSDSGLVYEVPVRITKRERQKTIFGKVWCWRLEPVIFGKGRLIEQKGNMIIWLMDDDRKIPIRAHINTTYGEVDVRLRLASK